MADILIAPGSTMPNAPTGQVTLFLDTENNNILSYIDENGVISLYNTSNTSALEECCSCEIAKKWIEAVTCALKSGMLTADQFGTITNQGLTVVATETTDALTGAKSCRVDIGPKTNIPVISVTLDVPVETTLNVGDTLQLSAVVLPATAPQGIVWISSNPLKAAVSASGLVYGVSAGTVVIYAYSAVDSTKFDIITLTIA